MSREPWTRRSGYSLIELLLALAVASLLLAGVAGTVGTAVRSEADVRARVARVREAEFAMRRIVAALRGAPGLQLPLVDDVRTPWDESVRDVLAVVLDPRLDRDADGFADADNDRDGRIDEDPGEDMNADGAAGILGIDDDGDGSIDETGDADDDEDADGLGAEDEELPNGSDDDGDGSVDEDLDRDLNQDGAAGVAGVDDDGDGATDETNADDDDEDEDQLGGGRDEDWYDSVVFYRLGSQLIERFPAPHAADGTAYSEDPIASGVSGLVVERLEPGPTERALRVRVTLQLTGPDAESFQLQRTVRVGGEL